MAPGDLVIGDDDGVCVVPKQDAESVLGLAIARQEYEVQTRTRLANGETLWNLTGLQAVADAIGLLEEPVDGGNRSI